MRADQAIPWTTRFDLQSVEFDSANSKHYSVKDPVKDEYYAFDSVAYFILSKLKSRQSFRNLVESSVAELGHRLGISEIQHYIKQLASDNLIVPHSFGDGNRLLRQHQMEQRAWWLQQILGLLSIRVGGFYPGGLLKLLSPLGWAFFNPVSLVLYATAVVVTLMFASLSVDTLGSLVPSFGELSHPSMLFAVAIGFCVAKVMHELAHALACQYQGRECSEMGLLLLIFLPCMYCDVSDMWTQRRRKRLFVTLAGIWAELGIAVIGFWIWYLTVPGSLHTFCYSLMLITSVNTFLLNGNPLMRYDGYYALSDILGIPNLSAVAKQNFRERVNRFFWFDEPVVRQQGVSEHLWLYELLARFYRVFILSVICFGIWKFFDFQELTSVGSVVIVVVLTATVLPILFSSIQTFRARLRGPNTGGASLRWVNLLLLTGLSVIFVYFVSGVEFSHRVWGTVHFHLADPQHLFAPSHGRFIANVRDGQAVLADELIGTIKNPELELEQTILAGQLAETRLNLELNRLKSDAVSLAGETEFWTLREKTLRRQLEENQAKQNALRILAPQAGQLIATERRPSSRDQEQLSKSIGTLLDQENEVTEVNRGDPVGYVGIPGKLWGILNIDQKDIELIEVGHTVKVAVPFDSVPRIGKVTQISVEQAEPFSTAEVKAGSEAEQVAYQVVIELDAAPDLRVGSQHAAVVLCRKTNLISFVGRWVRNSFWF